MYLKRTNVRRSSRKAREKQCYSVRRVFDFLARSAPLLASTCTSPCSCLESIGRARESLERLATSLRGRSSCEGKTALVLCGGGARGAAEVGLYAALEDLGVSVDLVVGSSVGAVVGAFVAAGVDAGRLADIWRRATKELSLRPRVDILWKGLSRHALFDSVALRRILERELPVARFEDLLLPLAVVATDIRRGEGVVLENGDIVHAVLASCAVPGLFPPVTVDGRILMDGSLSHHLPVAIAAERGATRAIVIRCRGLSGGPIAGVVDVVGRALQILLDRQMELSVQLASTRLDLWIVEPCYSEPVSFLDFEASQRLLEDAYRESKRALARIKARSPVFQARAGLGMSREAPRGARRSVPS